MVDATDARFLDPPDMDAELRGAAGLPASAEPRRGGPLHSRLAGCRGRRVVVEQLGGAPEVLVIGGGVRNRLLLDLIEEACGVPVRAGAAEATAMGNALVQGVALGRYADLATARIEASRAVL